jgi:hypothetical protein
MCSWHMACTFLAAPAAVPGVHSPPTACHVPAWRRRPSKLPAPGKANPGIRAAGPPGGSHQLQETFLKLPVPAPVGWILADGTVLCPRCTSPPARGGDTSLHHAL